MTAATPAAVAADFAPSAVRSATPRSVWVKVRLPLAIVGLIVLTALAVTFFRQRVGTGALDPNSVSPEGSRALAQLLGDRGVDVRRVEGPPATVTGTVFVPFPGDLTAAELTLLTSPAGDSRVVLVRPTGRLDVLGVTLTSVGGAEGVRDAGCAFGPAATAGRADAGGSYDVGDAAGAQVDTCYSGAGRSSLVHVQRDGSSVTVVGADAVFTNDRLDAEGDAALAIGLLDNGGPVTWVMRRPAGSAPAGEAQGLSELLPDGVYWGLLQLVIAAAVTMAWRARRLGPVVTEPLPVVVRAAEAVEGRGRLYAAGKARGRAGWNLRRGAQDRLRQRLTLPQDAAGAALVEGAAARTSRPAGDIGRLLYGPDPVDDAGLVRLATDLDHLDDEVRRS